MRKTFKRSLALVLAMLMLLSVGPIGFAADEIRVTCKSCKKEVTLTAVPEIAATCQETGRKAGYVCPLCKVYNLGGEVTPKTEHNYSPVEAKPASCAADGNIAYFECTTCDSVFLKEEDASGTITFKPTTKEAVTVYGHTFTSDPVFSWEKAEDTYKVTARFLCDDCHQLIPVTAKVTSEVTKEATCAVKGEITYTAVATMKGKDYTGKRVDEIPTVAHKYVLHEAAVPNCEKDGNKEYYTCETCTTVFVKNGEEYSETTKEAVTIPKSGDLIGRTAHTDAKDNRIYSLKDGKKMTKIIDGVEYPYYDCKLGGVEYRYCSVCKQEYSPVTIPAKNHEDENFAKIEPTCTEPGRTAYTACKVCGYSAAPAEVLPAIGHDPEKVKAKESTCTENGNFEYYKCTRCNALFYDKDATEQIVDDKDEDGNVVKTALEKTKLGFASHDFDFKAPVAKRVDAECIKNGSAAVYKCTTCNKQFREYLKEKGDEIPDDAFVNNGDRTTYKDDPDYAVYYKNTTDTTIKMLNHIWVQDIRPNSVGYVAPKCNAEGSCIATCSRCGSKTTLSLDKIPHISKQMLKEMPATCERGAYEIHRCAVCNETYELDLYNAEKPDINADKAPIGHTWSGEVTVVREATCTEKGLKGRRCLNGCGKAKDTVEIAMIPHKLKDVKVDPTCTEDGYTAKQCEMCGQLFEKKTISNLNGHIDANKDAKCDRCGELLCDHICHKTDIFSKLVWFIAKLWYQYLGINQTCKCGVPHYDPPKTPTT